jgi:hypothetical protein
MKSRFSSSFSKTFLVLGLMICSYSLGCKAGALSEGGTTVVMLYSEPVGCEDLGVVIGRGGGLTGAYSKPRVNQESAENDALNEAAELGATHLLLHPEEVAQGDGHQPTEQDTEPAMAHGYGTGSTVTVAGTAYKCPPGTQITAAATSIKAGGAATASRESESPKSISLAPLGALKSITVFHRSPLASGTGMGETEVRKIEDPSEIERVVVSLKQVAEDPMKYIPTDRVEFVGELGVQSLLYGFGYLQYAGGVYRLTTADFEEVLRLREVPPASNPVPESGESPTGD